MSEETRALLYAIGIYVIFFVVVTINYGAFAVTAVRWTKRPDMSLHKKKIPQPSMTIREMFLCYIPVYQVLKVYWTIKASRFYFVEGITIFAVAGVIVNMFNKFIFAINSYVMLFCNIWMIISVLIIILLYAFVTAKSAYLYNFSWVTIILCFFASFLWCWYLKNNIPDVMRDAYKEEVFSEHTTNIKAK